MSLMIVQQGEISKDSNRNKGAIYNAIKAAVRKSILMQIAKARAANGFH
jgi:hypothetical protein